jgi:hypothetical protein
MRHFAMRRDRAVLESGRNQGENGSKGRPEHQGDGEGNSVFAESEVVGAEEE